MLEPVTIEQDDDVREGGNVDRGIYERVTSDKSGEVDETMYAR